MDQKIFLIPLKVQEYFETETRFNIVSWRDNLTYKMKKGAYVINLDEYARTGTRWIALFCTEIEVICFDSFVVEHVPRETEKFIEHKT